jgi:heavy metal sensor kinase
VTLRQRLFIWYGSVVLVTGGLFVMTVYLLVAHHVKRDFYELLAHRYEEAARITKANLDDLRSLQSRLESEVRAERYFPMVYRLYDRPAGKDVLLLAAKHQKRYEMLPVPDPGEGIAPTTDHVVIGAKGSRFVLQQDWPAAPGSSALPAYPTLVLTYEEPLEVCLLTGWLDKERHPGLILQVGLSYQTVSHRLRALREYFLLTFVVILVVGMAGAAMLTSRALKPIHDVAAVLEQMDAADLSYRLRETGAKDEVGRIVTSVNVMLGRLEQAFERLNSFTADTAHELRTPLAGAKLRLEVALDRQRDTKEYGEAIEDALAQLSELNKLIDQLLLLANLDARPEGYARERVDLCGLLADVVEFFVISGEQERVQLTLDCQPECAVTGNPGLVRRLISNLIENAISNTPPGGKVEVRAVRTEGGANIIVRDTGRGMEPAELARIFERFYRGEAARASRAGGVGLGLGICKKVVEVHGGIIKVESEPGKGTTFTVYLPLR